MEKKTFRVRMAQEREFYMEVEGQDEMDAIVRALRHAHDGERIASDEDSEWGEYRALRATELK
jgi:hypothetical protein